MAAPANFEELLEYALRLVRTERPAGAESQAGRHSALNHDAGTDHPTPGIGKRRLCVPALFCGR
jgi:hypothetical protein